MHTYNGAGAAAGCMLGRFYTAEFQDDPDIKRGLNGTRESA
jgi:hypothetical protein